MKCFICKREATNPKTVSQKHGMKVFGAPRRRAVYLMAKCYGGVEQRTVCGHHKTRSS